MAVTFPRRPAFRIRALRVGALLVAAAATLVTVGPVAAHAELVSSKPAANSTVPATSTLTVTLTFSAALKTGSKAEIVGPDKAVVGTARIDPSNNKRLTWTSPLPPASGAWEVRWTSIATDGDVLRGTIPFAVSGTAPSSSAVRSASASPSATPSPSPSPTPSTAFDATTLLPVIAALVIIAILGLVLMRSRRPAARR